MRLSKYPRPTEDTGIGFHYVPDTNHYAREDLHHWLPKLQNLGTSWLVLPANLVSPIPEAFLREVKASGIEPVVGLGTRVEAVEPRSLYPLLKAYVSWGANYAFFFREPNQPGAWSVEAWAQPALVERFMEALLPCLEAAADVGLYPLFTPLASGGTYWDTAFLASALQLIQERGKGALFDRMGVAIQNFAHNRPLTWGKGGHSKWRSSGPYRTPQGGENQQGFHLFAWYDEVVRREVGQSLPLIAVANGFSVGCRLDEAYPAMDADLHAQRHVEMAHLLMDGELPDYVFNHAFWLLAADGHPEHEVDAWFKADGTQLPAVDALRSLTKHAKRVRWEEPPPQALSAPHHKPIYHYLLFAQGEEGIDQADWAGAQKYIKRFKPTCGFSVDEAMNAEFVTVVGDVTGVSPETERMLRAAGCWVERVAGSTYWETKKLLNGLAKAGTRFVSV